MPVPSWFERSVIHVFDMYPGAMIRETTTASWWQELSQFSEQAIRIGMRRALDSSVDRMPNCMLIKEHVRAAAKSLPPEGQDLTRRALPEPEPMSDVGLSPENPFYVILERFKAGGVPGSNKGAEFVSVLVNTVSKGKSL